MKMMTMIYLMKTKMKIRLMTMKNCEFVSSRELALITGSGTVTVTWGLGGKGVNGIGSGVTVLMGEKSFPGVGG